VIAKDIATLLAAGGALLFFGYKVIAGWLLLNLSVSLTIEREPVEGGDDHLLVKILLDKGKVDAARLLSGELRITALDPRAMRPSREGS